MATSSAALTERCYHRKVLLGVPQPAAVGGRETGGGGDRRGRHTRTQGERAGRRAGGKGAVDAGDSRGRHAEPTQGGAGGGRAKHPGVGGGEREGEGEKERGEEERGCA